jgi:hypothetical protein
MAVVSPNVIRASGAHLALIERDEPLATLARHLAEAAGGSGRFVVGAARFGRWRVGAADRARATAAVQTPPPSSAASALDDRR